MTKLLTVNEARLIEQEANAQGITTAQMVELAGSGLAEIIESEYGYLAEAGVVGLIGSGNNGSDTLAALYYLAKRGWRISAYIIDKRLDDDTLITRLKDCGEIIHCEKDREYKQLDKLLDQMHVWIDGIIGTGIKYPLKKDVSQLLTHIRGTAEKKQDTYYIVAVDCPSGIDSDSGETAPETIPANITVIMGDFKVGLLRVPAINQLGDIRIVDIGIPKNLSTYLAIKDHVADVDYVADIIRKSPYAHKEDNYGKLLFIGGSANYPGAVYLSNKAALRAGAGSISIGVPDSLYGLLAGQLPEADWILLPHELGVIAESAVNLVRKNLDRVTCLLLGPGIGDEDTTRNFLDHFLSKDMVSGKHGIGFVQSVSKKNAQKTQLDLPPVVLDITGEKLIEKYSLWIENLPAPAILILKTHDLAAAAGVDVDVVNADKLGFAKRLAMEWGHVMILKDIPSIIAAPDGQATVVPMLRPIIFKGGNDYVLAGLVAGLRAQGINSYPAAIAGTWLFAMIGKAAGEKMGNMMSVSASDLLLMIPDVLRNIYIRKHS